MKFRRCQLSNFSSVLSLKSPWIQEVVFFIFKMLLLFLPNIIEPKFEFSQKGLFAKAEINFKIINYLNNFKFWNYWKTNWLIAFRVLMAHKLLPLRKQHEKIQKVKWMFFTDGFGRFSLFFSHWCLVKRSFLSSVCFESVI